MDTITLQLVTPERTVLQKELTSLTCNTGMGQITILPGHIPLVANLEAGELHAKTGSDDFYLYVAGGFVEVRPGNRVVILADDAEHHYDIDLQKAVEARERAKQELKDSRGKEDQARISAALGKYLAQIHVATKHARRGSKISSN